MTFNKRLKKLRMEQNLRQKDIAEDLNLTPSAIGFYEQGKRNPDYEILSRLADYFGVSVDYLLGRTEKRQFYNSQQENQARIVKETQTNDFNQNNEATNRDELVRLVKQAKSLSPKAIQTLVQFIQIMEEE